MKPMHIDAVRSMVALLGTPKHEPQDLVRHHDTYDNPTHPLQKWVDELHPWQRVQVRAHFITPGHRSDLTPAGDWTEAWIKAIYDALWY